MRLSARPAVLPLLLVAWLVAGAGASAGDQDYIEPLRPRVLRALSIGNCGGPASPGERLKIRARVEFGLAEERRLSWGVRAMAGRRLARWLQPARSESEATASGDGRTGRTYELRVTDHGPLPGPVRLVGFARIGRRAAVASAPRFLRLGTTLTVSVVDEAGRDLPTAQVAIESGGCTRRPGAAWRSPSGTRRSFYHLDPEEGAVVTARLAGYDEAVLRLSPARAPLVSGTRSRLRIVMRRPSPATPGWSAEQLRSPLYSGDTTRPVVYLTFDDCCVDDGLMATILARQGVRGTFCITGSNAEAIAAVERNLVLSGHALCSHGYSHSDFTLMSDAEVIEELESTDARIRAASGVSTRPFFRPPFGTFDDRVVELAAGLGYRTILWDVDPRDWACEVDAPGLVERVTAAVHPGAVVLLHSEGCVTAAALPSLVASLRAMGYSLETFRELPSWK